MSQPGTEETDLDWAWAVGLFEGEGCIHQRQNKRGYWTRLLTLASTDLDVVERFQDVVGAGHLYYNSPGRKAWKPQYVWRCTAWPATERILTRFLPMLGERRSEAARALLANPAMTRGGWPRKPKARCANGHPYTEKNTYTASNGWRTCRTCKRERQRERRASEAT